MTSVLVMRARADAERTAVKVRQLGFTPVISPVLEILATGAPIPKGPFDAALATSAKAFEHAGGDLSSLRSVKLFVVGARTGQAAMRAGLHVRATAPDAATLTAALHAAHTKPTRFLYLAGRDRKNDLERALRETGHNVSAVEVYAAEAAQALSDEAIAALTRGDIGAILHYSPRSAAIFLELATKAGLTENVRGLTHLALSDDVARPLREEGCARIIVAKEPDEEHLLARLQEL